MNLHTDQPGIQQTGASSPNSGYEAVARTLAIPSYHSLDSRIKNTVWGIILFILLSGGLLACKGSSGTDQPVNPADTAGLAAFNAQKIKDSLGAAGKNNGLKDQSENSAIRASHNQGTADNQEDGGYTSPPAGSDDNGTAVAAGDDDDGAGTATETGSTAASATQGTSSDETAASAEEAPAKKKKFSNASKGALIGAGSGAVLGAVVDKKNRGLGAVIGAAVGGGAGYGIGKHKDNKQTKEGN